MALVDYSTALVTGASSGIGEAVVRSLSNRGLAVESSTIESRHLRHACPISVTLSALAERGSSIRKT